MQKLDARNNVLHGHHGGNKVRLECKIEHRIIVQLRGTILFIGSEDAHRPWVKTFVQH